MKKMKWFRLFEFIWEKSYILGFIVNFLYNKLYNLCYLFFRVVDYKLLIFV